MVLTLFMHFRKGIGCLQCFQFNETEIGVLRDFVLNEASNDEGFFFFVTGDRMAK